jgi:hypothetical protein
VIERKLLVGTSSTLSCSCGFAFGCVGIVTVHTFPACALRIELARGLIHLFLKITRIKKNCGLNSNAASVVVSGVQF